MTHWTETNLHLRIVAHDDTGALRGYGWRAVEAWTAEALGVAIHKETPEGTTWAVSTMSGLRITGSLATRAEAERVALAGVRRAA